MENQMGLKKLHKKGKTWIALGVLSSTALLLGVSSNTVNAENVNNQDIAAKTSELTNTRSATVISPEINLFGLDKIDDVNKAKLQQLLTDTNHSVASTNDPANTNLLIGILGNETTELVEARTKMGLTDPATLNDNAYIIGIDPTTNQILLEGKDDTGLFYALNDLKDLIKAGQFKATSIVQSPDMKTRGVIEGFYQKTGPGWSTEDRKNQLEFYGQNKMNTYIYAPKDDSYHRKNWRDMYPEDQKNELASLVEVAKKNKVDFVFAISPGNTISLTGANSEADFQALMTKMQSMYDIGVRSFAIFFDDISMNYDDGIYQAQLLNRFNTEFVKAKGDVTPLITVPTQYDNNAMRDGAAVKKYTSDFAKTLDQDITVLWTGPAVVPDGISAADAQFAQKVYGDRLGIWWNYPTNDYMLNKLGLGPIYALDKTLGSSIKTMVMNPMGDAELSKITLLTGAKYMWDTENYDSDQAFKEAIATLYPNFSDAMYTFANHSTRLNEGPNSSGRADAPEVRAAMDALLSKATTTKDLTTLAEYTALKQEFAKMQSAATTLRAELPPTEVSRISANLTKLADLGKYDDVALDLLVAKINNNTDEITKLTDQLNQQKAALASGAKLSEYTALAFINDALNFEVKPTADFEADTVITTVGTPIKLKNNSSLSAQEFSWNIPGSDIKVSTEKSPTIKYNQEGSYTITLTAKNLFGEDVVTKKNYIVVKDTLPGTVTNLALGQGVKATAPNYVPSESPNLAIDGRNDTKWTSVNIPHELTIDLGKLDTITGFGLVNAGAGGEGTGLNTRAYRISVSTDGQNYQEVVHVTDNTASITSHSIPAIVARYARLTVDTPTQASDKAARIYEFQVNGLEGKIDIPAEYIDKDNLTKAIADAEAKKEADYTADSFKNLQTAITDAKKVLADQNATQQAVDQAVSAVKSAVDKLEKKPNTGGNGGNTNPSNPGDNSENKPGKPETGVTKLTTTGVINYIPGYGVLLRDKDGKIPTHKQYLKTGTNWKVNAKKVINGVTYYRVGTDNQWIEGKYLQLDGQTIKLAKVASVKYNGRGGVLLLNKDGKIPAKRQYVKANTRWKVLAVKNVNGRILYSLGNDNQWIPAQYLKF